MEQVQPLTNLLVRQQFREDPVLYYTADFFWFCLVHMLHAFLQQQVLGSQCGHPFPNLQLHQTMSHLKLSSSIRHQLCRRHTATTIMICLLAFLQISCNRCGNQRTSRANALSTTDLRDAKCVFNFFLSACNLPPLTWHGVIR